MDQQKKKISENWSTEEKDILREMIAESRDIIEDKSTRASSNIKKTQKWKNIARRMNKIAGKDRSENNIKLAWKRMKLAAKINLSTHRRQQVQTGGGERPKSPSQEHLAIVAIAPHDFFTEYNTIDSDKDEIVEIKPPEEEEVKAVPTNDVATVPTSLSNNRVEFVINQGALSIHEPCNSTSQDKEKINSKKGSENKKEPIHELLKSISHLKKGN